MSSPIFRIGADENGLGARLGPLVVTAVLARVTEQGQRVLSRRPPKRLRDDLGDSKLLVSHGDVALGEAWSRALSPEAVSTPAELFSRLSLEGLERLREPCPSHVSSQCWSVEAEQFVAGAEAVDRLRGHLDWWKERGVEIVGVRSSVVCTKRLNESKRAGGNRFTSDLHAMERLVLELRSVAGADVLAVCGKVGGMGDYSKFFGPLSMRLHAVLERTKKVSAYHFPGVGELRFLRDADGSDALVMLASIVGKYVRELLMSRVSSYYRAAHEAPASDDASDHWNASGYHDPVTTRFVDATRLLRKKRRIPEDCFERIRDEV